MRLIDAIRRVERPEAKSSWDFAAPVPELCNELSLQEMWNYDDKLNDRLKAYPIFNWLCTDEMVGLYAIYLDGEAVGCYYRECRKCGYEFHWISRDDADAVRQTLLQYRVGEEPSVNLISSYAETSDFRYLGETDTRLRVTEE